MSKLLIDLTCPACGHTQIDAWVDTEHYPACPECSTQMERLWSIRTTANVIGDDIPGGVLIYHGICHDDGTPRRYYSKSEMARVAQEKGLVNVVRHVASPGTDKSANTTRWI